mgnify:CR=1 FL=1
MNKELINVANSVYVKNIEMSHEDINIDYCKTIIKQGSLLVGYGFMLARDVIYKGDREGFELFCVENKYKAKTADGYISLYKSVKALGGISENILPDKIGLYNSLKGNTPQEKADFYKKVKMFFNNDNPKLKEILVFKYANERGIIDKDFLSDFINKMTNQSDLVLKIYYKNRKQAGLKNIIDAIDSGLSDIEICDIITGAKRKKETVRTTSRKDFNKLSDDDKYKRLMYLEKLLTKYTNEKEIFND